MNTTSSSEDNLNHAVDFLYNAGINDVDRRLHKGQLQQAATKLGIETKKEGLFGVSVERSIDDLIKDISEKILQGAHNIMKKAHKKEFVRGVSDENYNFVAHGDEVLKKLGEKTHDDELRADLKEKEKILAADKEELLHLKTQTTDAAIISRYNLHVLNRPKLDKSKYEESTWLGHGADIEEVLEHNNDYLDAYQEKNRENLTSKENEALTQISKELADAKELANDMSSKEADKHTQLPGKIIRRIKNLKPGQCVLIPGGYSNQGQSGHSVMYAVEKRPDGQFTFTVINTGEGTEPASKRHIQEKNMLGRETGRHFDLKYCVSEEAVTDEGFITGLLQLNDIRRSETHSIDMMYDHLDASLGPPNGVKVDLKNQEQYGGLESRKPQNKSNCTQKAVMAYQKKRILALTGSPRLHHKIKAEVTSVLIDRMKAITNPNVTFANDPVQRQLQTAKLEGGITSPSGKKAGGPVTQEHLAMMIEAGEGKKTGDVVKEEGVLQKRLDKAAGKVKKADPKVPIAGAASSAPLTKIKEATEKSPLQPKTTPSTVTPPTQPVPKTFLQNLFNFFFGWFFGRY